MKEIGGYLELELTSHISFVHDDGALLNTGSNALEYILRHIDRIDKVWLSYYTCETVLEPIKKLGLSYDFYRIDDQLEVKEEWFNRLGQHDYLIYNDSFGIKDDYIRQLYNRIGTRLIVDYAQSFGSPYISGSKAFYSPRKSYGVPDGGIAYPNYGTDEYIQDQSHNRFAHLLTRCELPAQEGLGAFRTNNESLVGQPIRRMSELTQRILSSIDMQSAAEQRRLNFNYLHKYLEATNPLAPLCSRIPDTAYPAFYPYYCLNEQLRRVLIDHKVFVATYWPNVLTWLGQEQDSVEYRMTKYILPLPIDQRYGIDDMERIINIINENQ